MLMYVSEIWVYYRFLKYFFVFILFNKFKIFVNKVLFYFIKRHLEVELVYVVMNSNWDYFHNLNEILNFV